MTRLLRTSGLAAVLVAGGAAGTRATDEVPMAPIEVEANAPRESEERAPTAFVTDIDVEPHREQMEDVSDALAETVGVQVQRFGGLGAFSTISIRGSSSNQVRIFLDGVPLSRARNETVNLSDLPLDSLERIEVYRGTTPLAFGSAGLGGVVNLVPKRPSATPETELAASYGSFDTRKVVASHSRRLHGVDLLGFLTYLGSEGDFDYRDDANRAGTPATGTTKLTRVNNDFDSVEGLLEAGYSIADDLRVDLTSEVFFKDQGLPGAGEKQARDTSLATFRSFNYLRLAKRGWLDRVDATATLFGQFERDEFDDPKGELRALVQKRRDDTTVVGGKLDSTLDIGAGQALSGLLELSHERFAPFNELRQAAVSDEPDQTRLHLTAGVQDEASFFDDRVLLVPTVRYEHFDDDISPTTPAGQRMPPEGRTRDTWSASIGAQIRPWSWLALKGNIGRFERAPNFSELFGDSGFVLGRADLDSETAINRDVGFTVALERRSWLDRLRLEYAYFNNDVDDIIQFIGLAQGFVRPLNLSAARLRGHEVAFTSRLLGHLGLDVNYTRQDAEERGAGPNSGKQLPLRAEDELYLRAEGFAGPGRLFYEFNFVGENFQDRVNFVAIPSRSIHSLGVSVRLPAFLTLSFEARNVTDDQIRDFANFPLPGRSFFGTVRARF